MAGIYIHIPFCSKACHYCDFYFSTSLSNKTELVLSIVKEIELRKNYLKGKTVETIYFGGGTPGLLSEKELGLILNTLFSSFKISENPEITLEANPENITIATIKQIKKVGINRLSIGVQSFVDEHLLWMNRSHTAIQSIEAIKIAQDLDVNNLSVDLIYGIPEMSMSVWEKNINTLFALKPPHFSAYCLTVEPKTVLSKMVSEKKAKLPDDDTSLQQFNTLIKDASSNGFIHYEISNFAKANAYSRHNTSYWTGKHYLGIGPSAHSFNGHSRQWNISNNNLYIKNLNNSKPYFEKEVLTEENRFNEYILTSLRTMWGIDINKIELEFPMFFSYFNEKRKLLLKEGVVTESEGFINLSKNAKFIADKIALDFFVEK